MKIPVILSLVEILLQTETPFGDEVF